MLNLEKMMAYYRMVRKKQEIEERVSDADMKECQSLKKSQRIPVMTDCHQAKWEKTSRRSENKSRAGF